MTIVIPSSSSTDEPATSPIDNTPILEESPTIDKGSSPLPLLKKTKDAFKVTALKESITKTAVVDDIHDAYNAEEEKQEKEGEVEENEEEEEEDEEMDEEYVSLWKYDIGGDNLEALTNYNFQLLRPCEW